LVQGSVASQRGRFFKTMRKRYDSWTGALFIAIGIIGVATGRGPKGKLLFVDGNDQKINGEKWSGLAPSPSCPGVTLLRSLPGHRPPVFSIAALLPNLRNGKCGGDCRLSPGACEHVQWADTYSSTDSLSRIRIFFMRCQIAFGPTPSLRPISLEL